MRLFTYMIVVMLFSMSGCSSQKKLVDDPPFETGDATCQRWVGGRAESGSGMLLSIPITGKLSENAEIQKAYFRGKVADVNMKEKDGQWLAIANFIDQKGDKPDMIMHSDPKKEVGNQPPKLQEKFPFELEADECVMGYEEDGKMNYFKVAGIKEKKPLAYQ
ncbi:hypothetical protein [Allomuricauda sp. SCSIO 65647]|uniref:hypothetical protein n=1 Tax=Allomuricauda sp. SCSIO 65647 TaxID=2908843 RepID=UPI001F3B9A89|nr:hypothetical protein [Muricauda sp. SCSIO 65647]UJH69008.1 hypothetical protein L0P89_07275 [Muricauda sp. SCSIO 65647]